MVRLLLADVTRLRGTGITVHVRFNGGALDRQQVVLAHDPRHALVVHQHPAPTQSAVILR